MLRFAGGLLRYTGRNIQAAAVEVGRETNGERGGERGGGEADATATTGPAAKVAVKMVTRDPGRAFAAGERVAFVFVAGPGSQQDRAEDPYHAVSSDLPLDYQVVAIPYAPCIQFPACLPSLELPIAVFGVLPTLSSVSNEIHSQSH